MEYTEDLYEDDDVMTVQDFFKAVHMNFLGLDDGFGCPVKDGKAAKLNISADQLDLIPEDATHIVWYNK